MSSLLTGRSTRMDILHLLRRGGAAGADQISNELGITPNAVRQHLTNLERDGLVTSRPEKGGRGRPHLLFTLTPEADAAFPKRYGQLATMVLTELEDMVGAEALDEVFSRVARRHARELEPALEGKDFDARLDHIVGYMRRAGTLAEREDLEDGSVRVSIHNCPFRNTAIKFPQVCSITPRMIAELVKDAGVSQTASIHRQDPYCSFVVQRPAGDLGGH